MQTVALIDRKVLSRLHDVATGAPAVREGFSIFGVSREGQCCTEGDTGCTAADEPPSAQ
jgi:hypothetical protein